MMVPRPPVSAVPPMTTIAITSSSYPLPLFGLAAEVRIELMMPAKADMTALKTNSQTLTALTLTPRARAATALPPVAWIQLPNFDCVRT